MTRYRFNIIPFSTKQLLSLTAYKLIRFSTSCFNDGLQATCQLRSCI